MRIETMRLARRAAGVLTGALLICCLAHAETIKIGIGTQNTTTNTVTGGVVIQQLGLLEKFLPRTGKYAGVQYQVAWQNYTSGPPIINGMMADNLQIGMMGDYPLLINGATGQNTGNETELVAVLAYNRAGSGNGIIVSKDSPFYRFEDLKGHSVSVPFGSAAHGMLLKALADRGLKKDYFNLVNQSPEVGITAIQEKRIDGHADFVPFAELLPFRGDARKIFDGAQTGLPTFHGVVIRKDFGEKYPEVVQAYLKAVLAANDWLRADPRAAAEKIAEWTKIDKEVAYVFLGPSGIHTLDPTIKPAWIDALKTDYGVLKDLGMIKDLDIGKWVNDRFLRGTFQELGMDYEKQLASFDNYRIGGRDALCKTDIADPDLAGEIWTRDGGIEPFSSPLCTLQGVKAHEASGQAINAAYLMDRSLGVKVFAPNAWYAIDAKDPARPRIVPFMLRADAQAHAERHGGMLATYAQALAATPVLAAQ